MATIGSMLRRAAQRFRDKPALVCGPDRRTFAEVDAAADRVANLLARHGIGPGDRVAVVERNSVSFVENEFGILKSGAAEILVNPRLTVAEQLDLLRTGDPVAVLVAEEFADRADAFGTLPSVRLVVRGGEERARLLAAEPGTPPDQTGWSEDLLWRLHFSSGTTGRPKAATLTHRNFRRSVTSFLLAIGGAQPSDVLLNPAPLVTAGGWSLWPHYLCGATSVLMPRFDPGEYVTLAARHAATTSLVVPTMLNDILDVLGDDGAEQVASLRTVLYTAAPISAPRIEDAVGRFGPVFVQSYSMSETMSALSVLDKDDHRPPSGDGRPDHRRSSGRPAFDVDVEIRDDDGNPVPVGGSGRIAVRTDATMRGYWRDPERTAEVLRDGWLLSGDVGRLTEDGYLYVLDRIDDVIISGGFNVYPLEVEDVISRCPGVRETAVFATPDERLGQTVTAVVVPRDGHPLTAEEVSAYCVGRLAGYKRPRRVELRSETLPRNAAGKVLRRDLRLAYGKDQSR